MHLCLTLPHEKFLRCASPSILLTKPTNSFDPFHILNSLEISNMHSLHSIWWRVGFPSVAYIDFTSELASLDCFWFYERTMVADMWFPVISNKCKLLQTNIILWLGASWCIMGWENGQHASWWEQKCRTAGPRQTRQKVSNTRRHLLQPYSWLKILMRAKSCNQR